VIDGWLNTKPAFLIVGSLLGGAGGVRGVYKTWTRKT
jgi:F0F1-type ATP synthase assembly protein I